jgi:hypothetical protein
MHGAGRGADDSSAPFRTDWLLSCQTNKAIQPTIGGGMVDAFLLKLRVSDWSLLFSTYLGGSKNDGAYAVALDSSGNPIVSGVTESDDFPSASSAFQPRRHGPWDALVTKTERRR